MEYIDEKKNVHFTLSVGYHLISISNVTTAASYPQLYHGLGEYVVLIGWKMQVKN